MPATTLHLVRHAQPESFGDDPGLTDLGRRQSAGVTVGLGAPDVAEVLHSSRARAVQTAEIIARSLGVVPVENVHATDLTPIPDDWSMVPSMYHEVLRTVPAAEQDIGGVRLDTAFDVLGQIGEVDRTTVMVTHNFVIGWFVRRALDAPWPRWMGLSTDHAAITTIRWSTGAGPVLQRFNAIN